jgi:hypothetical protein
MLGRHQHKLMQTLAVPVYVSSLEFHANRMNIVLMQLSFRSRERVYPALYPRCPNLAPLAPP